MDIGAIVNTLQRRGGFITTSEIESRGEYEQLRRATEYGAFVRIRKGVYAEKSALANNMIDVERVVPHGVLCLYSAFAHYGLSTQVPSSTCIAIEARRKVRLPEYPPIDLYFWKKENLEFGVIQKVISGYAVLITDMERAVCDAVKYRNKIGLDVCGEVIDSYLKKENRNISQLHEYAQKTESKKYIGEIFGDETMTKNTGKSIRVRLLNLAKEEKQEYMKVLVRYLHERLLFRISASPYKRNFLLKGSSLLFALDGFKARPTVDIDLLGERISNDKEKLKEVFQKVCGIDCEGDGVAFDASSLELEPIAIEKKYPGVCVKTEAHLDTIVQQVSVDIGFGDVVTPYPMPLDYPLLLPDIPAVEIYAYSLETLIAEKFHTMVDRDESNSRMKDFFDVYQLFTNHEIDRELLAEAIAGTFRNRNTPYRENLALFTDKFAKDATRNIWWKAFLKKIRWKEQIDFPIVMECIKENLQEYWNKETLG